MNAKKVPGAAWQYIIYDLRDRPVFTQDGNLRLTNNWLVTLYDELNRAILTGIISYNGNPAQLQTYVNDHANQEGQIVTQLGKIPSLYINERDGTITNYEATQEISFTGEFESESLADFTAEIVNNGENQSIIFNKNPLPPNHNLTVLKMNFYDQYDATTKANSSATIHTKGLLTVSKVRVIEDPQQLSSGAFLETVSFYDPLGREFERQQDNYKGGLEISNTIFDFRGNPLDVSLQHNNPAAGQSGIEGIYSTYAYDNMGRKDFNEHHPGNWNYGVLNYYSYNKLGQLITEDIGTKHEGDSYPYGSLEILNYEYNVRGWLKGINRGYANGTEQNHFFGFDISYNHGFELNQFNGNISGVKWRSKGDNELRAYGFGYDKVNRLLFADFNQQFDSTWSKSDPSNSNYLIDFTVRMGNGIDPATAYDENGNIRGMKQWGLKLNSSSVIDNLVYNYKFGANVYTNKLLNVIDSSNDINTSLGDFRTSTLHSPSSKTVNTIDYTYDINGNLKKDLNKDIGTSSVEGIQYNHLNLPYKITVQKAGGIKGKITYIYDADGNKLEKRVIDNTDTLSPIHNTTYIGSFVYENDSLQFFGQDHGRVRVTESNINSTPVKEYYYDYFLKDHLGNVRMVLTDQMQQDVYPIASLENVNSRNLEDNYYRINSANVVDSTAALAIPGYTNNNNIPGNNLFIDEGANSQKLYRLNGSNSTDKMGLGITLKVMAGDIVDIFGKSYWKTAAGGVSGTRSPIILLDLLNDFIGNGIASKNGVTGSVLNNLTDITIGLTNLLDSQQQTSIKPKAYLNWILFDENFRPVISNTHTNSGFEQVGIEGELKSHYKSTGEISKNGYLYIYCSNESQLDVFFDNLQVVHTRGPLLEETHYYPFGLTMAGISTKAAGAIKKNKGYNANELQDTEFADESGLKYYDFNARTYDQQIGRFMQMDPAVEKGNQETLTPYHFSGNNPSTFNDPSGKCPWCIGAIIGAAVEYGSQVTANLIEGKSLGESLTDVDLGSIAVATVAGAATGGFSAIVPKTALGKVAVEGVKIGIDVGESVSRQLLSPDGNVSLETTFSDVVTNKVAGGLTNNINVNSNSAMKTTEKQLDRAQRVAANDPASSGRAASVDKLEKKLSTQKLSNQAAQQGASSAASTAGQAGINNASNNNKTVPLLPPIVDPHKKLVDNTTVVKYIF